MNVVGIIAEYNPFHQGHAWHLAEARRQTDAAYTVIVMSGNYVQRGVPAMFDKYTRAQAALQNGADLVLELPPCTATGSAEYFASGAVQLLSDSGVITDLCFGSECGDLEKLSAPAAVLFEEPKTYQQLLREALRLGKPWPKARAQALHQYDASIASEILQYPNDLLALEYLKARMRLHSSIRPHAIPRTGAAYHEDRLGHGQTASASGIRKALLESRGHFTPRICAELPSPDVYAPYEGQTPITEDAFSLLLMGRLRQNSGESFASYFDVTEELSRRISKCLDAFVCVSQFTDLLKTRNLTRTAVSRALLHILLDIRTYEPARILRVLGFRRCAEPLLKELAQNSPLPLVTSPSDERIPEDWQRADRLYESVRSWLHGRPYQNEQRRRMLVL